MYLHPNLGQSVKLYNLHFAEIGQKSMLLILNGGKEVAEFC